MNLTASKIISYLLHPLLMPTIGYFILFNSNSYLSFTVPEKAINAVYVLVFVNTFILPALIFYLLYKKGILGDLYIHNKNERTLPYSISIVIYGLSFYYINESGLPKIIPNFLLGATLAILFTLLVNLKWKISAHLVGFGGLMGAVFAAGIKFGLNVLPAMLLLSLLGGYLASARLRLGAHTPSQVYVGFLAGFLIESLFIFYY